MTSLLLMPSLMAMIRFVFHYVSPAGCADRTAITEMPFLSKLLSTRPASAPNLLSALNPCTNTSVPSLFPRTSEGRWLVTPLSSTRSSRLCMLPRVVFLNHALITSLGHALHPLPDSSTTPLLLPSTPSKTRLSLPPIA
jgi:hypothetical protein